MKINFLILFSIGVIVSALSISPSLAQQKGLLIYGLQLEELEFRRGDEGE